MKSRVFALALLPMLAACSKEEAHDHDHAKGPPEHAHVAPNGGDLITLGNHEAFLEVKLDHAAGSLAVWVHVGEDMKPGTLDSAPLLNLKTGAGAKQLTGEGSGGKWTFRDEALKGEPENARFRISMGGKTYSPAWEHQHGDHDHDGEDQDAEGHEGHDHDGD